jgi:tRNA (Thr-GGU) A37 N-methylase
MMGEAMRLEPVGMVHSPVRSREDMPIRGVSAQLEIYEKYAEALQGIDGNSHLLLLCWLHEADRSVLKAVPRKISSRCPSRASFQ